MIKSYAIKLLGMVFPQDKASKLNHSLSEIQVFHMLNYALDEQPDDVLLPDLLRKRVLQVVQNRKHPRCASEWKAAYAANMQSRIIGESSYQYSYNCAEQAVADLGIEWMVTTPADAVQAEMECWDE